MASFRSTSPHLSVLLAENSTRKYFIEYREFLSNHVEHGIVALDRLGASVDRVQQFVDWYVTRLEPADRNREDDKADIESEEAADVLLGGRKQFYALVKYYENALRAQYAGSVEALVGARFPKLSAGMATAALHGLIHLGYGFACKSPLMVCEGLAYLHHSYAPVLRKDGVTSVHRLGKGELHILDVLDLVRDDKELGRYVQQKENEFTTWNTSSFQRRFLGVLQGKTHDLLQYVMRIEIPDFCPTGVFDEVSATRAMKWLVDSCIVAYIITEIPNYFFMLHGVTGTWSLKTILTAVDVQHVAEILQNYLCILLGVYLAEGCPRLDRSILTSTSVDNLSFDDLRQQALAPVAEGEGDKNEHVFKLLQVCIDMSLENTDPEMNRIYRLAGFQVLKHASYRYIV